MNNRTTDQVIRYARYSCPLCDEKFTTKAILRQHIKREHIDIEGELYIKLKNYGDPAYNYE